jgi:Protein of unknown function (DUF2975)
MGQVTIGILRVIIALSLLGSVVVQVVIVPLLWMDLAEVPAVVRVTAVSIVVIGVLAMQVFAVCVWRLLTLVRRGSVFSTAAFRFVDVIIGSIVTASAAVVGLSVLLREGHAAPGIVAIVFGFSIVLAGMALLVVIMKNLLRQAIDREDEAARLRSEMNEVI